MEAATARDAARLYHCSRRPRDAATAGRDVARSRDDEAPLVCEPRGLAAATPCLLTTRRHAVTTTIQPRPVAPNAQTKRLSDHELHQELVRDAAVQHWILRAVHDPHAAPAQPLQDHEAAQPVRLALGQLVIDLIDIRPGCPDISLVEPSDMIQYDINSHARIMAAAGNVRLGADARHVFNRAMAFLPLTGYHESTGVLRNIYEQMMQRPLPPVYTPAHGDAPGIIRAHSLDPELLRRVFRFSGTFAVDPSITWPQRELVNAVTSRLNQCFY